MTPVCIAFAAENFNLFKSAGDRPPKRSTRASRVNENASMKKRAACLTWHKISANRLCCVQLLNRNIPALPLWMTTAPMANYTNINSARRPYMCDCVQAVLRSPVTRSTRTWTTMATISAASLQIAPTQPPAAATGTLHARRSTHTGSMVRRGRVPSVLPLQQLPEQAYASIPRLPHPVSALSEGRGRIRYARLGGRSHEGPSPGPLHIYASSRSRSPA